MKHGTLILPAERARYFVELIGKKVQLQIEDMNQLTLKRNYRKYIQSYYPLLISVPVNAGIFRLPRLRNWSPTFLRLSIHF